MMIYNVLTWCNYVLCLDERGSIIQTRSKDHPRRIELALDDHARLPTSDVVSIGNDGSLAGYVFHVRPGDPRPLITLRLGDHFLSAQPTEVMELNRSAVGDWESFHLIKDSETDAFLSFERQPEIERERFVEAVARRGALGQPVTLHFGCGNDPRPSFLNVDAIVWSEVAAAKYPAQFFVFPFVDIEWGIPENSVDYVFHEDLIEHLTQIQQIQFLAEAYRVLKPGCYHRVNTPHLITSMAKNSSFDDGMNGVYKGELKWGHQCILTPRYLEEIALMIGYRAVVFTTKDHGVSPYAEPDMRPGPDRDPVIGNIYADLMK